MWGANPSASAPHQHDHWLPEAPGRVIVVDPVRTPTARAADLHLQPFPGSDAALAFALLHVIDRDGLCDRELLARYTVGFDELEPQLAECTPEWGERVTGVPAALIERAARLYAAGPSLLWIGQGFQRQPRGGNAVRAVALLPAVTGNLGRPGTGLLYLNGGAQPSASTRTTWRGAQLAGDRPDPISHMDLAARLEDREPRRSAVLLEHQHRRLQPRAGPAARALAPRGPVHGRRSTCSPTDTADLADIVLPAASFLESDDLVASYFHHSLSAQVQGGRRRCGESLPNAEIFRRLAAAMGYTEPQLHEGDARGDRRAAAAGRPRA